MENDSTKWRLIDNDKNAIYTYAFEIKDLGCLVRIVNAYGKPETLSFVPGAEVIREENGEWKIQAIPLPPMPMGFPGGQGGQILIPMIR